MKTKWRKVDSTAYINEDHGKVERDDEENGDRPYVNGLRVLLDQIYKIEFRTGMRFGHPYEAWSYASPDAEPKLEFSGNPVEQLWDIMDERTGAPKAEPHSR